MPSFRGWVCNEVGKLTKGFHKATMEETFTVIRHDAEMRGRAALLQAMGVQNQFHVNADFHHAVNVLVQAVVAGVFGEIPLTAEEKAAKLALFEKNFLATFKMDFPEDSIWSSYVQASGAATPQKQGTPITMEEVKKAAEQMKKASPYGTVLMGVSQQPARAGKSGLPAAQDEKKAEEAALAGLLGRVEKKSDELLGIKQKAKYEELIGIDPEEI